MEDDARVNPYQPAREVFAIAALERASNTSDKALIDWGTENHPLSAPLGWSNGWANRSSGANFPEFVYAGFDSQDGEQDIYGQKKKRLDEVSEEVVLEAQGQIDWHIGIG